MPAEPGGVPRAAAAAWERVNMGNFEKLSVLVIVVIIVMILVVALYTWSDNPGDSAGGEPPVARNDIVAVDPATPSNPPSTPHESPFKEWDDEFGAGGKSTDPNKVEEPKIPDLPPVPEPDPEPKSDPADKPVPAVQENWMYTVKPGDTLTEIAERELGTWRRYTEILKLNPDVKAETIREGMTLRMPPKGAAPTVAEKTPGATPTPGSSSAPGGTITPGDWYVIQRGDRLSRIAKRAYKSIDRWPELWARNLSVISDPDEPPVGARIFIPK